MNKQILYSVLLIALIALVAGCGSKSPVPKDASQRVAENATAKITFLELGSTTCIPCKKMQPVMKSIEARYAGQVKVVFHDVIKNRDVSQQYGIRLIPTQVFLDSVGTELMRHEGFFAEEEIDKFLKTKGLTPSS